MGSSQKNSIHEEIAFPCSESSNCNPKISYTILQIYQLCFVNCMMMLLCFAARISGRSEDSSYSDSFSINGNNSHLLLQETHSASSLCCGGIFIPRISLIFSSQFFFMQWRHPASYTPTDIQSGSLSVWQIHGSPMHSSKMALQIKLAASGLHPSVSLSQISLHILLSLRTWGKLLKLRLRQS